MRESKLKRFTGLVYALIIIFLAALFFTNDFGLVDLRKTSVIIGVGIDAEDEELVLTAQLALPQPAENGEATAFSVVTGRGSSVALALNDINGKTGFYPKLVYCKLILVGESCLNRDVKDMLSYFYSNEFTGLTTRIAACDGAASELLSLSLANGDSTTDFIERLLSDEAKKSANVSTADLNAFGQGYFSKSGASYMPYIEQSGGSGQGESGDESAQGGSGSGGESSSSGQSAQSSGGDKIELVCGRTAIFTGGVLAGILDDEQAFAFNLINSEIRRTFVECGGDGERRVLGLRNCRGGRTLKLYDGVPHLKLSFSAAAKISDDSGTESGDNGGDKTTPADVLRQGEEALKADFGALVAYLAETGCDLLGLKDMLYKKHFAYFCALEGSIASTVKVEYNIKLKSAG